MKTLAEFEALEECPECGGDVIHRETSHESMTIQCDACGWHEEYSDDPQGDRIREMIPNYNPVRYGKANSVLTQPDIV
jgi:uncharacterized Zn finger protein